MPAFASTIGPSGNGKKLSLYATAPFKRSLSSDTRSLRVVARPEQKPEIQSSYG